MLNRLKMAFGLVALAFCVPVLASCAGNNFTVPKPDIRMETARGLVLANRLYLAANGLAQFGITSGVIKGADLDRVEELDAKINKALDEATAARNAYTESDAVQTALDLIFDLEDLLKKKGIAYEGGRYNLADRSGDPTLRVYQDPGRGLAQRSGAR